MSCERLLEKTPDLLNVPAIRNSATQLVSASTGVAGAAIASVAGPTIATGLGTVGGTVGAGIAGFSAGTTMAGVGAVIAAVNPVVLGAVVVGGGIAAVAGLVSELLDD